MTTSLFNSQSAAHPSPVSLGYHHGTPATPFLGNASPSISPLASSVQFGGLGALLPQAVSSNVLARGVAALESRRASMRGSAFEWGKMVDDTLSSTGSRLLVSNSKVEALEVSVTETLESLLVYFGLSALANKYVLTPMAKLAKVPQSEFAHLKQSLMDMPKAHLKHHIPARVATIIASLGIPLFFGEYAMLFWKNLGSAKLFDRGSFAQLLNLEETNNGGNSNAYAVERTVEKSKKGLAYSIAAGVAAVALAVGVARFGPTVLSNVATKRLEHFRKVLSNTFGGMDFRSELRKMPSGETVKRLGLNLGQIRTYMGLSGIGYLLAARDNLERKEILPRFAVIFLYMGWFNHLFEQKALFPFFKKRLPELFEAKQQAGKSVLATKTFQQLSQQGVFQSASPLRQKQLAAGKATLFLAPYVVGMGVVSLLNAAINRYLTHQRYQRGQEQKALKSMGHLRPLAHA